MDLANYFNLSFSLPVTDPTWIFLIVLVIILFAPLLLTKLKIPHIIGMILAGILVGEHGLNILERDSSFQLFGQVGIYYIMFLAGLEMDLEDFKKNKSKTFFFGLATFIIPMALGIWTGMDILGYSLVTSTLLASMYASHTLIAYPIISRYGLSRQRSVSISIGGTAITVTLALLILAGISGMYKGTIDSLFWLMMMVKVAVVLFIIIYVYPRLSRWFFRRYDDSVMQYVFVLALVFLACGMMSFIGMEGILGAFIAGMVLNRFIPRVSPLMNRIEFIGNALFIPYFLIGVGMIIDLRTMFEGGEALKVAVVMTVVATLAKWLAAWVTQLVYKMDKVERQMIFGLSNAQAVATLAAVLIGYEIILPDGSRLLNDDVLNGTVVMILFTCIISSVVTERASAKMAQRLADSKTGEESMEVNRRILVPIANPETVDNLVNMALMMRGNSRNDSIIALSVANDGNDTHTGNVANCRKLLEKAAMVGAAADVSVEMVSRYDINIASGILHTMKEHDVTEVVIGLHRRSNVVDSIFGTIFSSLVKGTNKQLMIAKCIMPVNTLRRIVVAVPAKAEYESGFTHWVETVCAIGMQTWCKLHFFAPQPTLSRIAGTVAKRHKSLRADYSELDNWDDLLLLTGQVNDDHLLITVSSRHGGISYDPSFEKLPSQLLKYFAYCSFAVIIPEQFGEHDVESISFTAPMAAAEMTSYANLWQKVQGWFRRS